MFWLCTLGTGEREQMEGLMRMDFYALWATAWGAGALGQKLGVRKRQRRDWNGW